MFHEAYLFNKIRSSVSVHIISISTVLFRFVLFCRSSVQCCEIKKIHVGRRQM